MSSTKFLDSDRLEAGEFLGNLVEVAIVTADHEKTMQGLWRLGIGPWRVYRFSPDNTRDQSYMGVPMPFELIVCFADMVGIVWELMQPVSGRSIFADFLSEHGEGIHHVAYDCNGIPFEDRIVEFERRGFKMVQSGAWLGKNRFAFFGTEDPTSTCFETYVFSDGWQFPEPIAWYPHRSG